jgi:hypothetical protein
VKNPALARIRPGGRKPSILLGIQGAGNGGGLVSCPVNSHAFRTDEMGEDKALNVCELTGQDTKR